VTRDPHLRNIVAIGASAGGIEAICRLLKVLPRDMPASVLIVLHRPIETPNHLREILSGNCSMPVIVGHEGQVLRPGVCYLGEPSRHLTIGPDFRIHLLPDHAFRSSNVDALFFSLARHAGQRTIGVVMSGMLRMAHGLCPP